MMDPELVEARRYIAALTEACAMHNIGVAMVDPEGHVLAADELVCELLGRTEDELSSLADFVTTIVPEERYATVEYRIRRREDGPTSYRRELTFLHPSGERRPAEVAVVPTTTTSGDVVIVLLIWNAHVRQLRDAVIERYSRLYDVMPVGVVIWDTAGVDEAGDIRLLAANPAADRMLGFEISAKVGRRVVDVWPAAIVHDDALRTFAMRDSDRIEHFADLVVGDRRHPDGVFRHTAVTLPGGAVAHLLEDISRERAEVQRRRQILERLVDAGDEERRHVAMGVHDDPVQQLAAAMLLVEALRRNPTSPQRDERMATIEGSLRSAMASLRRLVFELSPPELVESGLEAALRSASSYLFADTGVAVTIRISLTAEPEPAVQTAAFRIVAEALTNVRKHAEATAVDVEVFVRDALLELRVVDDGRGFDERARPGHIGLRNMRERATSLGGRFRLHSEPTGTTVAAALPLDGRAGFEDFVELAPDIGGHVADGRDGEVESLRRERESLVEANAAEHERRARSEARAAGAVSLWEILDDDAAGVRDFQEWMTRAARAVVGMLGDACVIRQVSADGQTLQPVAGFHEVPEQLAYLQRYSFVERQLSSSYSGVSFVSDEAVLVEQIEPGWRRPHATPDDAPPFEIAGFVVVPMRTSAGLIGTLTLLRDRTDVRFVNDDLPFVQAIANGVGRAIMRHERNP